MKVNLKLEPTLHESDILSLPFEVVNDAAKGDNVPYISAGVSSSLPKVAVVIGYIDNPADKGAKIYITPKNIVYAAENAGFCPIFVSYDKIESQIYNISPAGVLLPGGMFQLPSQYIYNWIEDGTYHPDLRRFNTYIALLNYAVKQKLPTLALCAGMQIVACEMGGKLQTKINQNLQEGMVNHYSKDPKYSHNVFVVNESLLNKVTGEETLAVNSRHNSALAEMRYVDYQVTARAEDGVPEAVEPKVPWSKFALGVEWHPEDRAIANPDSPDAKIFKAFAKSISR